VQDAVEELMKLGTLPSSVNPDVAKLEKLQSLLTRIEQPIADDDARALVKLFGPDDCFGLAWTLLHIIETAPGWPLSDALGDDRNEWNERLKQRAKI
jgi:hypothetical protein